MKESITRKRRAASVANVGSQCDLSLKIPGTRADAQHACFSRDQTRRVPWSEHQLRFFYNVSIRIQSRKLQSLTARVFDPNQRSA